MTVGKDAIEMMATWVRERNGWFDLHQDDTTKKVVWNAGNGEAVTGSGTTFTRAVRNMIENVARRETTNF